MCHATENVPDNVLLPLAHLTLMLLRYLKDESMFKVPAGIMLFSVSDIFKSLFPRVSPDLLTALGRFR